MALLNEIHFTSVFLDKVRTIRIKLMQTAYTQCNSMLLHIIFNPFTLFPVGLNLQRRNAEVSLRMLSLMVTFLFFFRSRSPIFTCSIGLEI